MKKTLYSLTLSEDVVREIDLLAHRQGTNRSALVNRILAEYLDMATPEHTIGEIFRQIGRLMENDRELVAYVAPNAGSVSLKSSLQYRYRPTVKYSVELYHDRVHAMGELSVVFRTQSEVLLEAMTQFFRLWKQTEDELIAPYLPQPVDYALYGGRFARTLSFPARRDHTAADIAAAISDYVRLFDRLMKGYLSGSMTAEEIRASYIQWLRSGGVIL